LVRRLNIFEMILYPKFIYWFNEVSTQTPDHFVFASTNKHPKIYAKVLEIQSSQKILKVKKQRWGLTLSSVNVIVKLQKSRQSNTVME
jgi:hypothetical protein